MRSAVPLAVVGLALAACGTQEWSFFDVRAEASVDAGSVDAGSFDVGSDAVGSNFDAPSGGCTSDNDCWSQGFSRASHCRISGTLGRCVACVLDNYTQCPSERPRCDITSNRCVQCGTAGDCPPGNTCVSGREWCATSCADRAGPCPSDAPFCPSSRGYCVACYSDTDCPTSAAPVCDTGRCVQCVDDRDCRDPSLQKCDPITDVCVSCLTDSDCREGLCDPVMLSCIRPMPTH